MSEKIRLQKFMADCGVCSRRKAETYISQGLVHVNGQSAKLGDKVDPESDRVEYDGRRLHLEAGDKVYIMLNKPRGFVTTLEDEMGRKCITTLLDELDARVVPVGRLDRNSEGLLFLTNDGELVYTLTHPKHNVPKYYLVTVLDKVSDEAIERLNAPLEIDGYITSGSVVSVLSREPGRAVLKFELHEGRNRQIRKMCEAVGLKVGRLKRYAVGRIKLSELKPGKWRYLTEAEIRYLKSL